MRTNLPGSPFGLERTPSIEETGPSRGVASIEYTTGNGAKQKIHRRQVTSSIGWGVCVYGTTEGKDKRNNIR